MSTFAVPVLRVQEVIDHPNADRLSIVRVGDYRCVSAKRDGQHIYQAGDLVVYVPEAALVPEALLRHGFWDEAKNKGMLAGSQGDRVKAVRLRGVVSQGLLFPLLQSSEGAILQLVGLPVLQVREGQNLAEALGITKYEPPIPTNMSGEVLPLYGKTLKYDIENLKRYPNILREGETCVVTEKLHGTFCAIGYWPQLAHPELFAGGDVFLFSKGLGAQGIVLKNTEANRFNLYVRMFNALAESGFVQRLQEFANAVPVYVLGEVFGKGVQDLDYGHTKPVFRAFDMFVGDPATGRFLSSAELTQAYAALGVESVPVLYHGPYDKALMDELKEGKTTLGDAHIREGVVIRPVEERRDDEIGRVILKHVGDGYLLRSGGTEYN